MKRTFMALLVLVAASVAPLVASDIIIENATILTSSSAGRIENGVIWIKDGKIAGIGTSVNAPSGAQRIDATGKWVTPGIIDAHSHIAIDAINEGTLSVTSMVGTEDVINPTDFQIYHDLAGGVTTANLLHGSANAIGGKNVVVKLRWGSTAEEMKFKGAKPGIKFALGENVKRRGMGSRFGGNDPNRRYPGTRMGVEDVIRTAFTEAKAYIAEWKEYESKKAAGVSPLIPPRKDLQMEALAEVLRGERLVHSHSYRADEILMLIRVADDFGFTIGTFQHVLEGYKVAKEIAAHGAGASTFSDWWAYKVEAYDAIPYNAAIMQRKGVTVSINSDSGEEARHLNQEAAKTMRYGGLNEAEALALVTINPAKQLQIDDRVGSLEVGKEADLVIYENYPLSVYAVPQQVFIDGEVRFDRTKEGERLAKLEEERQRLLEIDSGKEGEGKKKKKVTDVTDVEQGGIR